MFFLRKSTANTKPSCAISIFGSASWFAFCVSVANTIYARIWFSWTLPKVGKWNIFFDYESSFMILYFNFLLKSSLAPNLLQKLHDWITNKLTQGVCSIEGVWKVVIKVVNFDKKRFFSVLVSCSEKWNSSYKKNTLGFLGYLITKAAYSTKLHNPKIVIGTKTASGNKRRVLLR